MKTQYILVVFLFSLLLACENGDKSNRNKYDSNRANSSVNELRPSPKSNPDSLFWFVKKQVDFGPRVPNTEAHSKAADWFVQKFEQYGAQVQVQKFDAQVYSGTNVELKNIIASLNPNAAKRILLAAHWDTRPFADHDDDDTYASLDGANDGGSGVAVLLELARIINQNQLEIGVDMILFDGEDWGEHHGEQDTKLREGLDTWWCLGSQYWSNNKHKANYSAYYGILLDMVGAKEATFFYDSISKQNASRILDKVWSTAHSLGYEELFIKADGFQGIIDDHVYVNKYANIPMIDIIDYRPNGAVGFSPTWHTQNDNLQNIEKATLEKVANVLLSVLFNE